MRVAYSVMFKAVTKCKRYIRLYSLLLLVMILQSCHSFLPSDLSFHADGGVNKSGNDQRQYRHIKLDNDLDVLLISDPKADKAAASLDVYMGSYQNPEDKAGLAHFLEHMLFLGTAQYPDPGEYQAFISQHGGSHNAYTSTENTNYFFDIDVQYLEQALDRFAPFFTDPNFDAAYVDRERNAVESEYRLKIKNDLRRQWDVLREVVSPSHPQSKFTVGNLETLADRSAKPVRDDLITMYDQYYSANLMKLVVLGTENLDQLQEMVSSRFSSINNKQVQIQPHGAPFIEPSQLPLQIQVKPVKELRELSLMFEIPGVNQHWRTKPVQYLSSLIGHEETGSLLDILKAKGWAEGLGAGLSLEDRSSAVFTINISLTPQGLANRHALVEQVFAWIALIKQHGIEEWRQKELARVGEINFRYLEKQDPSRYVSTLASRMHRYPIPEVLREPYLTTEFDMRIINAVLERLTPENLIILLTEPNAKSDRQSKYYQVPYSVSTIDEALIKSWSSPSLSSALKLPAINRFIPKDLSLIQPKQAEGTPPQVLLKSEGLQVWHLENTQFGVPRANIIIKLGTDKTATMQQMTTAELYINLVQDQLNSGLYAASLAGLNYSIGVDERGLSIVLGGYSENQSLLLESILEVLRTPDWSPERFQRVRQQLHRYKLNASKDYPFRQIISQLQATIQRSWTASEQAPVLENLTVKDMQDYSRLLLEAFDAQVIISGNHNLRAAQQIIKPLAVLNLREIDSPLSIIRLPEADVFKSIAIDHQDSVVMRYIQGDSDSIEERAKLTLIAQMLRAPFFNTLRTEKQLGYVVSAFSYHLNRVSGLGMLVQSPVASASDLRAEFSTFTEDFSDYIDGLSTEEFVRHQEAVLTNLEEAPKSLGEMNGRFAESLALGYTDFQFRTLLATQIKQLTISDIQQAYERIVIKSPRQLWVQTQDDAELTPTGADLSSENTDYKYSF